MARNLLSSFIGSVFKYIDSIFYLLSREGFDKRGARAWGRRIHRFSEQPLIGGRTLEVKFNRESQFGPSPNDWQAYEDFKKDKLKLLN